MRKTGAALLTAALFFAFLLCPAACADGVRDGLRLAAGQALPALFPFFVASGLLIRTGAGDAAARLLRRPLGALYGLPPAAAPAVALGLIGGYPVGAATVADLLGRGALTRDEAERAVSFCNCASPAFCIGLAGLALTGRAQTGAALYLIHLAAALLAGLIAARGGARRETGGALRPTAPEAFAPAFCGAVQSAAQTAVTVTAFLVVFSILLRLLLPVRALLSGVPGVEGLLELTCGLDRLAGCGIPARVLLPLTSFLLGFGGLSVHFQVRALLAPFDLRLRRFTLGKTLHGVFAAAITALVWRLFPASLAVFAPVPGALTPPAAYWAAPALAVLFVVLFPFRGGKKERDTV